jgi:type II secretory pathway component HofQ
MKMISATLLVLFGAPQGQLPTGQQQQLPAPQIEQQAQPLGLNTPFSINFRDAPLLAALNTLAEYGGLNLVITPDIAGTVTQDLNNVTLTQALDVLLPPRVLTYTIENGLLRVQKLQWKRERSSSITSRQRET